MRLGRSLALAIACVAAAALPLPGQVTIAISPMAGGYVPLSDAFEGVFVGGRVLTELSQDPAFLLGGRVSVRAAKLGVEAEAGYVFSSMDLPPILTEAGISDDAKVFLGSLNVVYTVFEAPFSPVSFWVSGGVGLVTRGGDFFEAWEDKSDPAGALGFGLRFGLGPLAALRVDLRDYIYSFRPSRGGGDGDLESKLQNDVIATVGLEFSFSPTP